MSGETANDWNPGTYLRFRGLRLRPAVDLLAAVPDLPSGDIVDLGCGTGTVGPLLRRRFPKRGLTGLDSSPAMLARAVDEDCYTELVEGDIASWQPVEPQAMIFSNAALHWLPRHDRILPRLAGALAPGGTLAVQMPRQYDAPAFRIMRKLSAALFPDRFEWSDWQPPVATPDRYHALLAGLGDLSLWETVYYQTLAAQEDGAHPVRAFSQATAARPILEKLSEAEAGMFLAAYDESLAAAYAPAADGSVLYPFRRLFMVLTVPA